MNATLELSTDRLAGWLQSLRDRHITLAVTDAGAIVLDPTSPADEQMVYRHRHALTVAASGSHAYWWDTVLGRIPVHPDLVLPGDYHDPACACCGQPAAHIDPDLLPWCDRHVDEAS